ncbi:MAG: hypothetical protein WBA22_01165 [Candidatus Methanofastidiosia archaeon]
MLDPSLEDKAAFPGEICTLLQDKIFHCLLCRKITQESSRTDIVRHALKRVRKFLEGLKEVNSLEIKRRPVREA